MPAPGAREVPALRELPGLQPQLGELCAQLNDDDLALFARQVAYEDLYRQLDLQGVEWGPVLGTLRDALATRPALGGAWVEVTWMRATSLIGSARWSEAEELLRAALEHPSSRGPHLGWIHSSLAQVAMSQERWVDALRALEDAASERERVVEPAAFAPWIDGLRAEIWILIGMPELARPWVEARWEQGRESPNANVRWSAFELWVECLSTDDDYAALSNLERDLRESGWLARLSPTDRARAERRFAYVLVERGQFQPAANAEARRRLEPLVADGALAGHELRWALESLTLAHLDGGDVRAAGDSARRLRALYDDDVARGAAQDWSADLTQLIALEALVVLNMEPAEDAAQDLAGHLAAAHDAWKRVRLGWANLPTRDGGIGYLFKARRQLLVEALLALELRVHGPSAGALRALEWLVAAQHESTLARRLAAAPTTFAEARASLLPPGRGLIAWIPLRGRSFALAADAQRNLMLELPAVARLEALGSDLAQVVADQVRSGAADPAGVLARAIDDAGAAFLPEALLDFASPWSELYVSGLDDAGVVPFELLSDGAGSTQGARRAVVRVPSIPALLTLVRRQAESGPARPVPAAAAIVIAHRPRADVALEHGVAPFDVSPELRAALRRGWAAAELRELSGPQAEPQAVMRAMAAPCAFAHVVAHGIERIDERPQGVLLAAGAASTGAVFAEDVETWRVPPLMLLSVCSTARSQLRRGDGSRSDIVAALFIAGAAAVAASSADLDLGPTLRVGAEVQAELQDGASLAAALRAARARFAEQGQPSRREWLAAHLLQVSGAGFDARLPPATARRSRAGWTVALSLAAAVLAAVVWRARRHA